MPYALAALDQAAGKCPYPVRANQPHEKEEHIVDFLCGLLGNILLWLRNRLGFRKDITQAVGYDQLRAAGRSFERPCNDADVEDILSRLRVAMTNDLQELVSSFQETTKMEPTSQCPGLWRPDRS